MFNLGNILVLVLVKVVLVTLHVIAGGMHIATHDAHHIYIIFS
jgi:hypothetical protein